MRRSAVALAALMLAAAGCDSASTGGGGKGQVHDGRITIVATEYEFKPDDISASPGVVRITLRNEGQLAHNIKVRRDNRIVAGSPTIQGGSTSFSVRLDPGRYRIVCSVTGHGALGQHGKIVVK